MEAEKRLQILKLVTAGVTGIPQSTISAIENDRVNLGVERAKQLAIALKCHPAVLVFPGWDIRHDNAA
ncbi:MAG: helix-turn-helix transcriptional regulator [Gammaproteobacteria bacterium]|nr:helix-turn-helix transcriptional regulator [Gammaproteobacteria bacterium]